MTAPDLLPCDFCGNDDIQDWGESTWSRPVKWMYCTECHAQGPRVMLERNEREEAWQQRIIAAWNTRATPAALAAPEVRALVELLREARADLADYVDADWPEALRESYPSLQAKWKRDMELCWRIDAALRGEGRG